MGEEQTQAPGNQNPQPTMPPPDPTHVEGTKRGEEYINDPAWGKERGRQDVEPDKTPAQRPAGTSTGDDSSKIGQSNPQDPKSPNIITP